MKLISTYSDCVTDYDAVFPYYHVNLKDSGKREIEAHSDCEDVYLYKAESCYDYNKVRFEVENIIHSFEAKENMESEERER